MSEDLYSGSSTETKMLRYCILNYALTHREHYVMKPTVIDIWLEGGSILIVFDRGEEFIEVNAKVLIGIREDRIVDIEVLLDREGIEKLRRFLKQYSHR